MPTRTLKGDKLNADFKRKLRAEMTRPEIRLWYRLRLRQLQGLKFRRQHGIGPYVVDFYCPERKFVIEVDGESHGEEEQVAHDDKRTAFLETLGIRIVRYTNHEVMKNIEGVLADVMAQVGSTSPTPPYKGGA
jgi:very-short-patch-repair endonuclease